MKKLKSQLTEFYIHQLTYQNVSSWLMTSLRYIRRGIVALVFTVALFYMAGIGLYLGLTHATPFGDLLIGRTVVISVVDLERFENQKKEQVND